MKKIIICILTMLAFSLITNAQSVVRKGNTFKSVTKSSKTKKDTLVTSFKWEDSKGIKYPIIVNKQSGRCYVWKRSGKTGKLYIYYLDEYISKTVCEELGVKYTPKQKK